MTASACLADISLLPLPASWNLVSQYSSLALLQAPHSHRSMGYLRSNTSQVFKVKGFKDNEIFFRSWPNFVLSGWGVGISFHLNGMQVKAAQLRNPQSEDMEPARGWGRPGLTVKSLNLQNLLQNLWNSLQNLWSSVTALQPFLGLPTLCLAITGPQLVGWHWTSAEPRHWFHPHHHSHKAVRSHRPLALLLMLPFPWVSCSTTALFPPPVPPCCSWLSVHCAVWPWVLQHPQESSWLIHHLPHGAGALPCQTPCQDEDFTGVRHSAVSWLWIQGATCWFHLLGWAFRGRWQRAPAQPTALFLGQKKLAAWHFC